MITLCPSCGGMRSPGPLGNPSLPIITVEATSLRPWCTCIVRDETQDDVLLTLEMLHDLLPRRGVPPAGMLDKATVQELLERIDRMVTPLHDMVKALEVQR